jgi:HAE1 family hydrophobic/amphiphilic exporter-1
MGLPSFSAKRPVLTGMVFLAVVILGMVALFQLQVELYQGENRGIISIIVRVRGGLPPVEVEKLITKPVEESVATVAHLKSLYSHSREAESRVTLEFEPGTDMSYAALEIREKFSRVIPQLPSEIEKPVIANFSEGDSAILVFAVTSETHPPEVTRETVQKELVTLLTRVDGVASVEVYGGRERKILVELDRDKMFAYNVSIDRVMDILGRSNINLLAGQVDRGTLEFAVRTMGAFTKVEEIGDMGIQATRQGSIIPLSEIATIKDAYLEPEDYARLNLDQNVTVYVKKASVARTIPVSKGARRIVGDFNSRHQGAFQAVIVADQAESIEKAIGNVRAALLEGIFLTSVTVYLFFWRFYFALTVLACIPISVIATFMFMNFFGFSINIMTMSGLALAIGILVDSSVTVLENTIKQVGEGKRGTRAAIAGSEEIWLPLVASQITNIVVFLPIVFIDKQIQLTYQGFAFTVTFSLIVSTFVALMLVPAMLSEWLRLNPAYHPTDNVKTQRLSQFLGQLTEKYERGLKRVLEKRKFVLVLTLILSAVALNGLFRKDIDWPTTMEENEFAIIIFPLAGARIEANDDSVKKIEELLRQIPDVKLFSSTVRKDEVRVFVRLEPRSKRKYSKEEIMKVVDEKGNEAIKEVHQDYNLIVDEGAAVSETRKLVINIFGHDSDALEKIAREVAGRVQKIPGYTNIVMTDLRKRPEYSLVVDKGRAALYGLSVKDIADSAHALIRGMRPTKFHEVSQGLEIETITRLQAIYRQKIEDLQQIYIASPDGPQVPLGELVNFQPSFGPQTIDRKDKFRYVFVKGDAHRALEAIAKEVPNALKDMEWPDDYYWRFGGYYEELMKGTSQLSLAVVLSILLVYGTLACLFQSYSQPLIILSAVPFATIGIWLALTVTRKPLSQPVFIGMVLLCGAVVNGSIMLIDRMNTCRQEGLSIYDALIRAGKDRLVPIIMTGGSTLAGFIPMAIGIGQGSELWSPLAITVIGGLLSGTLLSLFIVPAIVILFEEVGTKVNAFFVRMQAPGKALWSGVLRKEGT